jgi:uncharacterized surface protein with fasciclin (FAS1) repeats
VANIAETVVKAGTFTAFVGAMKATNLLDTLSGPGPYTVFAPTDAAFAKLPPDIVESLLADASRLASVLNHHVVPAKVTARDVLALTETETVQGQRLTLDSRDIVTVGEAQVLQVDMPADNGVIHVIDSVIMPHE